MHNSFQTKSDSVITLQPFLCLQWNPRYVLAHTSIIYIKGSRDSCKDDCDWYLFRKDNNDVRISFNKICCVWLQYQTQIIIFFQRIGMVKHLLHTLEKSSDSISTHAILFHFLWKNVLLHILNVFIALTIYRKLIAHLVAAAGCS